MKKLISLVLAIMLIASTLVCAMPLSISAAEAPIEATPLEIPGNNRGWQYVAAITTTMPLGFTTASGMIVKQNPNYTNQYAHESQDGDIGECLRFASMEYTTNITFGASTGLIVYVKTDAANQIVPSITSGGKSFTAKVGANYQYAALGATEWTTAQFTTGKTNSNYFGKFGFEGKFEGYVKIPYTSIGYDNDASYVFNPESDTVSQIVFRFKGLGSNGLSTSDSTTVYGDAVVGPVFVVTKDSASTKITVPAKWQPAPIEATPLVFTSTNRGWQHVAAITTTMPLDFTTVEGMVVKQNPYYTNQYAHESADGEVSKGTRYATMDYDNILIGTSTGIIIYVKTDAANQIAPYIVANSGNFTGRVGYDYQYAAIGDDEWTTAKIQTGITNSSFLGVISFDAAFEGFIKIPYTSLGYDNKPSYTLNTATDTISRILYYFKGLGSNGLSTSDSTTVYGDVVVGPVFAVNSDSTSTEINVPEEYKPQPLNIKTFDFRKVYSPAYNFSADRIEETNNYKLHIDENTLSDTPVKHAAGVEKWSYVENEDGKIGSGGTATLVMTPTVNTYMKDAKGVVFYVKFNKPNKFSPNLIFNDTKSFMLKPGQKVQVLANGSDEWVDKTVEIGHGENTLIYGMVSFDSAFEGYIKVPFTSCNNDGGFKPVFTGDNMSALTSIALRFKGIGDDTMYGSEVVAGVTGYFTEDTSRAVIGSISAPEYAYGDVNYDWKFDAADVVAARKDLLGYKGSAGYKISSIVELVRIKKFYAATIA